MRPRILIFVSKTGGGHISLAEALRDRLSPDFAVVLVDPQPDYIHRHYRVVSRHALWLWGLEFRLSDRPARSLAAHKVFTVMMERRVAKVITDTNPDLIISTYSFLTYEIVATLRKLGRRVPFAVLQADPSNVHHSWLTEKNADAVLCPTRETYAQTMKAGFSPDQVILSGWPVRGQFREAAGMDRSRMLADMGLSPEKFTIFLQGGGEGSAQFDRTLENLLSIQGTQIILAAGTNEYLLKRYQDKAGLYCLPFTRKIAPYMASADVIMGKAGPNMLFESVELGNPFIATSYIPGQERPNLEFIQRHGLGWVTLDVEAQRSLVAALVSEPSMLQEAKSTVAAYRDWNTDRVDNILPWLEKMIAG